MGLKLFLEILFDADNRIILTAVQHIGYALNGLVDFRQVLDCSPLGSNSALDSDALTDPKSETLKGPPVGENLWQRGHTG